MGTEHFQGLVEANELRGQDQSKSVAEDVLKAKNVLEDSISDNHFLVYIQQLNRQKRPIKNLQLCFQALHKPKLAIFNLYR